MIETLDPLRLPLWGGRLIEASAGTGKTWTIAALYLRLVLGHGDADTAFDRPLPPAQILVMTFTRAATRELSDRVRARLVEAARCFRGEALPAADDALLRDLLAAYAGEGALDGAGAGELARRHAAWRLAMAAETMDDAAIHTIDAWCQRMLREHAFDSGSLFDEALQADEQAMQAEAARDYWRQQVYPLTGAALDAVLGVWPSVQRLADDVRQLMPYLAASAFDPRPLDVVQDDARARRGAELAALRDGWVDRALAMRRWLEAQMALAVPAFNTRSLTAKNIATWFGALQDWASDPALEVPNLALTARRRLTPAGLLETRTGPEALALPPGFAQFEALLTALGRLSAPQHAMRLHAAAHVARRVQELKRRAGTFGFADMLERLDAALAGPNGERLRTRIVAQYPVALVDEFQDTSPLQYRIFDRLYRAGANERSSALFLIGDPKQSIYGFRGADIRSYLGARAATAGRHYMLGTNHRSTQPLVTAVNHLFERAERRDGRGAFLFREPDGPTPLPFAAVAARGRAERLHTSLGPLAPLTLVVDSNVAARRDVLRRFADRCAEHLVGLLNDPQAGFIDPARGFVPLRPADIAVLVRTGKEAEAVRQALRLRRVACVYLSDKDSVFASPQAADLLRWLRAVAEPLDSRLARAAFATASVGLPLAELARLSQDDAAFEARVDQLRALHAIWLRQGVLPMLRQTLHLLDLPARWLALPDGERRLTNLLHLAELLQAAAAQVDGEQALIRWLAQQIDGDDAAGDERVVRLESDADLVKVVTIHKSKGLEYPVVYVPFATLFRAPGSGRSSFVALPGPAAGDGRVIEFNLDGAAKEAAERDRLQEDLRLLYVALTRARHALWLGVAAFKIGNSPQCQFHRSALGYLLGGESARDGDALPELVRGVFAGLPEEALVLRPPGPTPLTLLRGASAPAVALREPLVYSGRFERAWAIGSFSALVRDLSAIPALRVVADSAREETLREAAAEWVDDGSASVGGGAGADERSAALPDAAGMAPQHRFPRGAFAGNFLHDQLEWLASERFAFDAEPTLADRLLRRCERQGWRHRADDVLAWLREVVATPLPPLGVALARLPHVQPEMEFWLAGDGGEARRIDALCQQHLLDGRERPRLPDRTLRGMLMGFIDLVFEHDGRYWVLDYKSNALGPGDADYGADALAESIAAHRYDVQAAIYLLALHRLLRARLGAAYDPDRQLGGAIFLFLRGIRGPQAGCHVIAPPRALIDGLDEALAGQAGAGESTA